tara:strand:- start:50 stop:616 length:567 start_codon:yes stop_codon:yes gene_type:complete
MSFVNVHWVPYVTDLGFSQMVGAASFSLIGFWSILGVFTLGRISDQRGRRKILAFSYVLRAAGFAVVLISMAIHGSGLRGLELFILLAGVIIVGASWNAVVAITAAYAADRFGVSKLGTIYGSMFAVMPLGSGIGAALGGYLFEFRQSYDLAIISNVVFLAISAFLILSIRERRRSLQDLSVSIIKSE